MTLQRWSFNAPDPHTHNNLPKKAHGRLVKTCEDFTPSAGLPMSAFLEDLVASALQGLLGAYFVGIESQRLKLDVFSGQLVLRDLPVREDALYSLQQPYRVRWGV